MLNRILNHAVLALVFLTLTLVQQYAFYAFKGLPIIFLSFGKYLTMFAFFMVFTLIKNFWGRFFVLSFIMLLNFFQMAHLSYFGTQILPNEIFLVFAEIHEVAAVITVELEHVMLAALFTLVPLGIGLYFNRKLKTQFSFRVVPVLLILYFLYNPIRTYVTGNTWGRQPSTRELAGMNVYLSLSYFLGKILPHKLVSNPDALSKNEALKLTLTKTDRRDWDYIILVLGESLSADQMSLFGYGRETTPYLDSLRNSPDFFHTIALSSGVSTDVSVAFFLNLGYGVTGSIKAARGEHCLFKSAKNNGYSTHFISAQSGEQLRYIAPYVCASSLDDYRSLDSIAPHIQDPNAAMDRLLLPTLSELLNSGSKRFIILHQRGSHGPWKLRSTTESQKFKDPNVDQRTNDYDNSVVEFDLFWKELNVILANQKTKTLVIYLSDHGESLGKEGHWGHGTLKRMSFEVPVLIQAFNSELPAVTKELKKFMPVYNLALYTTQQMGWDTNQSPTAKVNDFMIYGNDIDGFAGKAEIHYEENGNYQFKVLP